MAQTFVAFSEKLNFKQKCARIFGRTRTHIFPYQQFWLPLWTTRALRCMDWSPKLYLWRFVTKANFEWVFIRKCNIFAKYKNYSNRQLVCHLTHRELHNFSYLTLVTDILNRWMTKPPNDTVGDKDFWGRLDWSSLLMYSDNLENWNCQNLCLLA